MFVDLDNIGRCRFLKEESSSGELQRKHNVLAVLASENLKKLESNKYSGVVSKIKFCSFELHFRSEKPVDFRRSCDLTLVYFARRNY